MEENKERCVRANVCQKEAHAVLTVLKSVLKDNAAAMDEEIKKAMKKMS